MPFTPSHAAAALLFRRTPLVTSAVVIGAIAPDLPYFLPVSTGRSFTHTPMGLVSIDLAIGVVTFLAWVLVLRAPLLDLGPRWLGDRMPRPFRPSPVSALTPARSALAGATIVLSLVVGAATHLVWDSFTHPGWLVDHVPVLVATLGPLALHKWLQHASSIAGLVLLAVFAVRWARRTPRLHDDDPRRAESVVGYRSRAAAWIGILAIFAVSGALAWTAAIEGGASPFDPVVVFLVARVSIGCALAGTGIAISLWWVVRAYRERRTATTLPSTSA